jgi:UDP-glucose 4-epimerase
MVGFPPARPTPRRTGKMSEQAALVTGGAGFIGSHLVDALLSDGLAVTILDDFSTGRQQNVKHLSRAEQVKVVNGSVLDASVVDPLVKQHALVFHLAAVVGVHNVLRDPLGAISVNVDGTREVLSAAFRYGARVILASTSEIYGRNGALPFIESSDRVLGPTWVQRWSYSTAKALDEHLAFAYAERGLRVSIVRYFNVYGPRLHEHGYGSVVARFITQALAGRPMTVHGDGSQTRAFTYVSDAVSGTIAAGVKPEACSRVFNIGRPEEIAIGELAKLIRTLAGSESPITHVPYDVDYPGAFQDTPRRTPDVTSAMTTLGFAPSVGLRDGLQQTISWFRSSVAALEAP